MRFVHNLVFVFLKNYAIDVLMPSWQEYLQMDDDLYMSQSVNLDTSLMSSLIIYFVLIRCLPPECEEPEEVNSLSESKTPHREPFL